MIGRALTAREPQKTRRLLPFSTMANQLTPLIGLCVLALCFGCSSESPAPSSAGASSDGAAGATAQAEGGAAGANANVSSAGRGGTKTSSGGTTSSAGTASGGAVSTGSAGKPSAGGAGNPPPAVDGHSIYTLECHGDSKDCNLATVPCFGVSSPTPNVAAGWACANRCTTKADCSSAPSGAEAQAGCVPFKESGHCLLVCKNENQSFACPDGMTCYTLEKSPIGYCLWQ